MSGFKQHTGLVVPLDAANVDTDAIIPKQFLQKVSRLASVNTYSMTGASLMMLVSSQTLSLS